MEAECLRFAILRLRWRNFLNDYLWLEASSWRTLGKGLPIACATGHKI
jgi:hypothetical protein